MSHISGVIKQLQTDILTVAIEPFLQVSVWQWILIIGLLWFLFNAFKVPMQWVWKLCILCVPWLIIYFAYHAVQTEFELFRSVLATFEPPFS